MRALHLTPCHLIHFLVRSVAVSTAVLTLASWFGYYSYLELATHFRMQYALASTVCVILLPAYRSWKLLSVSLCCAILNCFYIAPLYSTHLPHRIGPSAVPLRVMLANVLGDNTKYEALSTVVEAESPDVVVLQEFTEEWQTHTQALSSVYLHHITAPRAGGSGMALFSRYPLEDVEVLTLDASSHLAIFVKVNVGGRKLTILSLHPPTPVRPDKFASRNEQFVRGASIMNSTSGAKMLIGDLNTTMWSPYFMDLLREAKLRDARIGFGLQPSWPTTLPKIFQLPIDHCLVGDEVVVKDLKTGGYTGSDHSPLLLDLMF